MLGTPDYANWEWVLTEKLYGYFAPGAYADEHIAHYTRDELISRFEAQGFRHEATRYILRGELILAFRKAGGWGLAARGWGVPGVAAVSLRGGYTARHDATRAALRRLGHDGTREPRRLFGARTLLGAFRRCGRGSCGRRDHGRADCRARAASCRTTSSKAARRPRAAANSPRRIWPRSWRARPRARRRQRHVLPAGADRGIHRRSQLRAERARPHLQVLRGRRGVLGRGGSAGAGAGRRGVRRLRHQRARAEVERLRRRRRERQVGADHGERSARPGRRADAVRRQGADLLRPLDLQVRRGRASGRRRRAADSHRRIGHLSLAGRAVVVERHAVLVAAGGRAAGARHQGVDHERRGQGPGQARRPRSRRAARRRIDARLQGRSR